MPREGEAKTNSEFMTIKEVAEKLHLHVDTVHRHCKTGKLDKRKLGGVSRITRKSVDAFIEQGKGKPDEHDDENHADA